MRTKTLVLAAAALTACVLTASAQSNVYSLNIVGYVNIQLTNGLNLIANPLDKDGTGTNNTMYTTIGTNGFVSGNRIYAYNPNTSAYSIATYNGTTGVWAGSGTNYVNSQLNPGGGVFVQIGALPAVAPTVTLVGNVLVGTNNTTIGTLYALYGSKLPIGGTNVLQAAGGYTPATADRVFRWNPATQGYAPAATWNGTLWAPAGNGAPNIAVGEGFWLLGHAGSAWQQIYTNAP